MKKKMTIEAIGEREIVVTRSFDAPRRLVWEAMSRPEYIRRWLYLPDGWTMTECVEDPRVGGAYRWAWNGPDGKEAMVIKGVYKEMNPPARSVRTENFELGGVPLGESVASLDLVEDGGKTYVTITVVYPSKQARDGAMASGMERGMSIGYDNLEAMIAKGEIK